MLCKLRKRSVHRSECPSAKATFPSPLWRAVKGHIGSHCKVQVPIDVDRRHGCARGHSGPLEIHLRRTCCALPFGEVLFGDGLAVEFVFEDFLDFGDGV